MLAPNAICEKKRQVSQEEPQFILSAHIILATPSTSWKSMGISQIPALALIVVHGVTASGLGDNELRNLLSPRQKCLKNFANNEKVSEVGSHDSTLISLLRLV
jgi:hypothetical protein